MDYLQVRIPVSPLDSKNRGQADSCGEYPMHPCPTGSEGERDQRSSYNVLAWLVGEFVKVECWLLMLFVFCCSCKGHFRSASPLISGPGRWANVEGDLRCPRPSGPEWERSSRVSPSAV